LPRAIAQFVGPVPHHAIDRVPPRLRDSAGIEPDQAWQLVTKVLRIRSSGAGHQLDAYDE
jgi:hypothetical protein